jgi:hypothetical protein
MTSLLKSNLTIAEVKKEKHDLEVAIAKLAAAFTRMTGLDIDDIHIVTTLESMQNGVEAYVIEVEVKM